MTQLVFIVLCFFIGSIYSAEQCGLNEEIESCPSKCEVEFCPKSENYNKTCSQPKQCPAPACKCRFNHKRNSNGICIKTSECPPFPCTRANEEYQACPPFCPTDDCSQATPSGRCPMIGRIGIVVECSPACRCKKGFWRKDGICVPYSECPNRGNDVNNPILEIFG